MTDDTTLWIERLIDAPPERVFDAWLDPVAMAAWYTFGAFPSRVVEHEARVGGTYRVEFGETADDVYVEHGTYLEIDRPNRLVMTETLEGSQAGWDDTKVTVEFHDVAGKTRMVLIHERFPSRQTRDGAGGGWPGFIDRIERTVGAAPAPAPREPAVRLERVVGAPMAEVFRAWTDPATLLRWYNPGDGWTTHEAQVDLRAGGTYRLVFGPPDGSAVVETGTYIAIEPGRLVMTCSLEAERGAFDDTVITITLADEDGKTRMSVVHDGFPDTGERDLHAGGWSRFLDSMEREVRS